MNSTMMDSELERRIDAALREMMPYLESAQVDDRSDATSTDSLVEVQLLRRVNVARRAHPIRVLSVAACVIALIGLGAIVATGRGRGSHLEVSPATVPAATTPLDTNRGSLLTNALPSTDQPLVAVDQPGWVVQDFSGFNPVSGTTPSAKCAGCGVTRLIVAADGPLFGGPIFTAWTLDADYDVTKFDTPVTIGSIPGRFIATTSRVRVVWPISPGRTAFVDAAGLTQEQVFAMAESLTFESAVPTMTAPPPGFSVVATPSNPGPATQQMITSFANGDLNLEIIATSAGLQGLLDWKSIAPDPISAWVPRQVNGVTVAFDHSDPTPSPRMLGLSATWLAGGWGYMVIGNVFTSEAQFLDVVSSLRLTDPATFATATSGLQPSGPTIVTPNITGTQRSFAPVNP